MSQKESELEEAEVLEHKLQTAQARYQGVVVTGINIPFGDLFFLLLQLALAMIPISIIVSLVYLMLSPLLEAIISVTGVMFRN